MYSILAVGPGPDELTQVARRFEARGFQCRTTTSAKQALQLFQDINIDLVLVILPLQDEPGSNLIRAIKEVNAASLVLAGGRDGEIGGAVKALEIGADEYLDDPMQDLDELVSVISTHLGARKSDKMLRYLQMQDSQNSDLSTLACSSPVMLQVLAQVRQICQRISSKAAPTILLTGETGTGKGLLAKIIHYNSSRRSRAFVGINCAALPATLIEAELFGHAKGAFTDARASRSGLFETAEGGSIFLDEIGAIGPELQAKLLTVIEDKAIRRIGSSEEYTVNVQVISAAAQDMKQMVESGSFRSDLYHRLAVLTIDLPPLRERGEDKLLLAEAFVQATCQKYGLPPKQISKEARKLILEYAWPGNVRELKNQIEQAVLLENREVLDPGHFKFGPQASEVEVSGSPGRLQVRLPEDKCPLMELESETIREALIKHGGNVSQTSRYLCVPRHVLLYRIKKHGLAELTRKTRNGK